MEHLFNTSLTSSADEFIEAYRNSLTLQENMKSHQNLAESRLSQLRAEHTELQTLLGETVFVSGIDDKADHPAQSHSAEREMRYLDQRYAS
jgi:hypothetical protein